MRAVFDKYFQTLFHSMNPLNISLEYFFQKFPKHVTNDMNASLSKQFTSEEVKQPLDQMAPLKSPGPDGFSACFY